MTLEKLEIKMKKQVWQKHHIRYESETEPDGYCVIITRGEHYLITQLQRFKSLSKGAKEAIRYELKKPIRKQEDVTNKKATRRTSKRTNKSNE